MRIMRDIFLEYERITKIIFHHFKHKLSINIFLFFSNLYSLFHTRCYFVFLIQYSLMSGQVQSDHFEDFFKPELTKRGYAVLYKKKNDQVELHKCNLILTVMQFQMIYFDQNENFYSFLVLVNLNDSIFTYFDSINCTLLMNKN